MTKDIKKIKNKIAERKRHYEWSAILYKHKHIDKFILSSMFPGGKKKTKKPLNIT